MSKMLLMMHALTSKREFVTQTFTTSQTWVAPGGVIQIVSLVGKGSDGSSSYYSYTDPDVTTYTMNRLGQITYPDGSTSNFVAESYPSTAGAALPSSYCENTRPTGERYCYAYLKTSQTTPGQTHSGYNNTDGTATTGFGYTFAGGVAAPATPVSLANLATTPGTGYPLVIPAGGSITITY